MLRSLGPAVAARQEAPDTPHQAARSVAQAKETERAEMVIAEQEQVGCMTPISDGVPLPLLRQGRSRRKRPIEASINLAERLPYHQAKRKPLHS